MIHNRALMIGLLAATASSPSSSTPLPIEPTTPRLDGRSGPAPLGRWSHRRRNSKKYKAENRQLQRAGRRAARKGRKK